MNEQKRDQISALFETLTSLERKIANQWNSHDLLGFSKSHILILAFLHTEGPKRPSAIAEKLKVTTGGVTVLTSKLLKAGLIEKTQNETDRRASQIHITQAGVEMLAQSKKQVDVVFESLFGMLDEDELKTLTQIFAKCAKL
ncbi:MarR family winged helix-turn-helix transcriptional regulator [Solibacillus daqui]|uniref:MarR family winged helix-turn-helix transcriptional regulator n=1 Tax=Solibacillus daqui TaxID=2912187 RepID=UPI0023666321|nr:MarR family transcriptional regulator [Solibacillus daqui]